MKFLIVFLMVSMPSAFFNLANADESKKNKSPLPEALICDSGNYAPNCFEDQKRNRQLTSQNKTTSNFIEIENYRTSRDDLLVQESMNKAALEMVTISSDTYFLMIWSLVLSAGGILLVWRTLAATQAAIGKAEDANSIARSNLIETQRTNVLQLQPWVTIGTPTVVLENNDTGYDAHGRLARPSRPSFKLTIPITNDGLTPIKSRIIDFGENDNWMIFFSVNGTSWPFKPEARTELYAKRAASVGIYPINPKTTFHANVFCTFMPVNENTPDLDFMNLEFQWSLHANLRFKDISTTDSTHRCIAFTASDTSLGNIFEAQGQADKNKFDSFKNAEEVIYG